MKIAEYIELVKQADLIDLDGNSRATVSPPPFQGAVEPNRSGKPPVDPRVEQAINSRTNPFVSSEESKRRTEAAEREYDKPKEPLRLLAEQTGAKTPPSSEVYYERPRINPDTKLPYRNPKTGLMEPQSNAFLRKPGGEPGFGVTVPKFETKSVDSPSYLRYKDHYSNRSVGLWLKDLFSRGAWKDWWNNSAKEFLKRRLNAEADFVNGQLNQELKLIPRFSLPDVAFSVGLPLSEGAPHIKDKTIQDSNKYNLGPTLTALDYAFVRTPEEALRQAPNIAGEYLQFGVSPLAPVNMVTALPNMVLPKYYQLPSFYKMHYEDNRKRTGEYKKDDSKYDSNLQEKQDQIYQTPNLVADYVGAAVDPFLQWLPGYDKGFGFGLKQRSDGGGIDYQAALKPIIGSESWDRLHGMREGYSEEDIQGLFNKAIANGFTPEEANNAMAYFRDANSKYGNALLMMAMSPEDLYNSGWVLDNIKDATPDKSIPEYLPAPPVGFAGPSLYVPKKNPAWLKEQLRLQKLINDQQVFKELYPFYRDIVGTGKTMSDEESKFLDSMLSLPDEGVKTWLTQQEMPKLSSQRWQEGLRDVASLPYTARYVFLAQKPYLFDATGPYNFINKYYHPKDREKVLKVLRRLSSIK